MKNTKSMKRPKLSRKKQTRKQSRKSKLMKSPWMLHVKDVQNMNPTLSLKDVLKLAGRTYKK